MTTTPSTSELVSLPDARPGDEPPVAKTIERADFCFGVIAARVGETRFDEGGRRYGVVFRRDVGDLCLQGSFSMSLGQDELMDLIAAASTAYHEIEALRRSDRSARCSCEKPFEELAERDGWQPDHDEVFASQIELG